MRQKRAVRLCARIYRGLYGIIGVVQTATRRKLRFKVHTIVKSMAKYHCKRCMRQPPQSASPRWRGVVPEWPAVRQENSIPRFHATALTSACFARICQNYLNPRH